LKPIRIIIFEDNSRVRTLLADLLGSFENYEVCATYENCTDAETAVLTHEPDIVIMDIEMPQVDGIAGVELIKNLRPTTQIIMYTVFEDDEKLFQCFCKGANGYILKKDDPQKLIAAVDEVALGGAPMSPPIARKMLGLFQSNFKKGKQSYQLSNREIEILTYLVNGYSNKMIAKECFISIDTVKSHLRNIYDKLHVNCGKEAIAKTLRERIID
jgi:DNA-binding NarL/FixJ family response regulator